MYKNLKIVFTFLLFCMLNIHVIHSQDKKLEKANELYDKFAFIEAGKLYKELINKGNNTVEAYTKLGDCYYYNANYPEAVQYYARIMDGTQTVNPEYYFRYAQSLNNGQKYSEAATVMKKYYNVTGKKDLTED